MADHAPTLRHADEVKLNGNRENESGTNREAHKSRRQRVEEASVDEVKDRIRKGREGEGAEDMDLGQAPVPQY